MNIEIGKIARIHKKDLVHVISSFLKTEGVLDEDEEIESRFAASKMTGEVLEVMIFKKEEKKDGLIVLPRKDGELS